MGKIADALKKHMQERKSTGFQALTRADLNVLMSYNRKTDNLLNPSEKSAQVESQGMEFLRNSGTIQRLLVNRLILPNGQLTPKGIRACEQLRQSAPDSSPGASVSEQNQIEQEPDDALESTETAELRESKDLPNPAQSNEKTPAAERVHSQEKILTISQSNKVEARPHQQSTTTDNAAAQQHTKKIISDISAVPSGGVDPDKSEKPATFDEDRVFSEQLRSEGKLDDQDRPANFIDAGPGIALDKKALNPNLVSLLNPSSYEAEQFKILRNNILFPVSGVTPKSILVTSAQPAEGKTFITANLAVSFALNINKHVLLVDCDLRNPSMHGTFGLKAGTGLSDYLTGHQSLSSLLQKTCVDKLTLLPGGSVKGNASELMSSERMADLLEEVKNRYPDRLIVIDSPPPTLASETAFLARHIDGVVLVVKYGMTARNQLESLMETVGTKKILGCVINQSEVNKSEYYKYKNYRKRRSL